MDSHVAEANARISEALTELLKSVQRGVAQAGVELADLEKLAAQEESETSARVAELESRHERRRQAIQRKWQRY
ncbi:hypothetical protein [Deinococcus humi]|uniref:Lon protease-like protein n=1 Tax=Deinococcus humi TaxID=662880 RepID=A0A7W8NCF2_9DEIO|nr:hypothetical protein [Deinococcus humi]MBB5362114.1 Lon protease-like protein [Deinococcus humi]GGO22000.1 hypothetical protein GCM10008949_08830 [Deinococcus humi]